MKTHHMRFIPMLFLAMLCTVLLAPAQAAAQGSLQQYIASLRKHPDDNALREKIIHYVRTLPQEPAIPEEARRHYIKALTLVEAATQPSDSADAIDEFKQALLIAPWWGEAYMKMGVALEATQRYGEASTAFKLFMATDPPDDVMRNAQDEIYKIEALAEKAARDKEQEAKKAREDKQAQEEAAAAQKAREQDEFLKRINGARYVFHGPGPVEDVDSTYDVMGDTLTGGEIKTRSTNPADRTSVGVWKRSPDTCRIDGHALRCYARGRVIEGRTGIFNEDGSALTIITTATDGTESRQVYKREH